MGKKDALSEWIDSVLADVEGVIISMRKAVTKLKVGDYVLFDDIICQITTIKGTWLTLIELKQPIKLEFIAPSNSVTKLKNKRLIKILYLNR